MRTPKTLVAEVTSNVEYRLDLARSQKELGVVLYSNGRVKEAEATDREAIAQWEASLREWQTVSPAEMDTAEVAKVRDKLENARVQLARQNGSRQ